MQEMKNITAQFRAMAEAVKMETENAGSTQQGEQHPVKSNRVGVLSQKSLIRTG